MASPDRSDADDARRSLRRELNHLLHQLERALEWPMIVLAFVWLVLLIVEFIYGLNPLMSTSLTAIWIVFIFDFLLRFALAPHKLRYLRRQWLTALSLAVPALRLLRVAYAARLLLVMRGTRGIRLIRVIGSLNRGMRALRISLNRRGVGYVTALTALVLLVGAAGMHVFERAGPEGEGFATYGDALWWTAMLLTTLGSQYWPVTAEGRILAVLLAAYSLGILGYITATLASFFVGRDTAEPGAALPSATAIRELRREVVALREQVRRLADERGPNT
ncbi:MAG: ion transporter [Phycisphaeraceae bacterium]